MIKITKLETPVATNRTTEKIFPKQVTAPKHWHNANRDPATTFPIPD